MDFVTARKFLIALGLAAAAGLPACSSPWTVTFNERVVYTPGEQRGDDLLADPNLQGCLNQILASSDIEDPASITLMACPSSGIETLAGIEALAALEQLDLSNNSITNIQPLQSLKNLRVLSLRNNDIRNLEPLMSLPIIRFVSLQGNTRLPCRQVAALQEKIGNSLNPPGHCN